MDCKTMLDRAIQLIARTDVDRTLLLFFMNAARRTVIRDYDITKFYQYLTAVTHTGGAINLAALNIKAAKTVEYDDGTQKSKLKKLDNYDQARRYCHDFTVTGTPRFYFVLGTTLQVLPAPAVGSINMIAEVWPVDLTDSATSADITTTEIPEAWIYLAAAEYLDYFDETDKGQYFRQKGMVIIQNYIAQLASQYTDDTDTTICGYYHNSYRRSDY